ncbi:hypothetical protein PFISCL1PPCAC_27671 [Pristionchus fissidentatus]|uniref:Peptidase S1 domain-containing protein n=1 Tax=Pristionchus fissidentatus TaxID=1538716 RepID=A0AAV5X095_9BILA|nr:hypothetical protein PFISCL1PPCAC_27671 [Pristionchus fissidentatus]
MLSMKVLFLFLSLAAISSATCGRYYPKKNYNRYKRIIGGNEVPVGKWPWQVRLVVHSAVLNKTTMEVTLEEGRCGGTVISDRFILTAAHCIPPQSVIHVYSGIIHGDREEPHNTEKKVISRVEKAIPHPNYNESGYTDDIGILILEEPLLFDNTVFPICLPNKDQSIPDDGQAVVAGFGGSNDREEPDNWDLSESDSRLRESAVPIIRAEICKQRFENTTLDNEMFICAGSLGHGTAEGDSGGPLMMEEKRGRWFQIGVTAFGAVEEGVLFQDVVPGVYTNVKAYCDWIKKTTDEEAVCEKTTVNLKDITIS